MHSLNIQYNPRLDQLRWLAATLVFLFHFHLEYAGAGGVRLTGPWTALITEGHTGVGLFFTLSGFLFMQIALHQHGNGREIVYRDFLRNRLLRIVPRFLVGMAAAMLYARWRAPLAKFAPLLLLGSVALVMWDTALMHRIAPFGATPRSAFWIFWLTLESLGWAALILAWVSFAPRLPGVLERALGQGGKISFSFYLLHMGLLHIFAARVGLVAPTGTPWVDALIMLAVAYGVTWALSTLSYHIVEEPFLRMRRSYGASQPQPVATV